MKGLGKKVAKIFLILVVIISGVVLLYNVVFPKEKLDYAYNVSVELENNQNLEYINDNINDIIETINKLDNSGENSNQVAKLLANCQSVFDVYYELNAKMRTGLLFNQETNNYNANAKKLKQSYQKFIGNLKDTKDYMNNTYIPYLESSNLNLADVLRYNDSFKSKYVNTLNSLDLYINSLYNIYQESAVISLQVNEVTKLQAKYLVTIGNGLIHKQTIENVIVNTEYLTNLVDKNFENLQMNEIERVLELNNNVDFNTMCQAIINNNVSESFAELQNQTDYQNLFSELFEN